MGVGLMLLSVIARMNDILNGTGAGIGTGISTGISTVNGVAG